MHNFMPRESPKGLTFDEPSKCEVHLARYCDINYMVERALAGDSSVFRKGTFADVSECPESLQEALNAQRVAVEAFERLPESVRQRWTSPEAFLAAASTPEGRQEFLRFGLAFEKNKEGPIEVKVINPSPAKPDASSTDAA